MREHEKPFAALTAAELYAILTLRQEVFVVEQTCAYLDCDGHDAAHIHVPAVADCQHRCRTGHCICIVADGVSD